jgi:HK97 family phage major capsid protein
MQFPKLTGGSTAFWPGEANPITSSQQTTGNLDLQGKKLTIIVPINNELLRYASPQAEAMVRMDMSRVAALEADKAMLEGSGGTKPIGITKYPSTGLDPLNIYQSIGIPADGNSGYPFQAEDVANMESKLPDAVLEPTAWVVRKDWFNYLINRRDDAVTPGDGKGPFTFNITREGGSEIWKELVGTKVVRSAQVSNARTRGTNVSLTYVLTGFFPDWIIARLGILEFLANNLSDTAFTNDQTLLRGIEILDAGARHAKSFVLCDQLAFA